MVGVMRAADAKAIAMDSIASSLSYLCRVSHTARDGFPVRSLFLTGRVPRGDLLQKTMNGGETSKMSMRGPAAAHFSVNAWTRE